MCGICGMVTRSQSAVDREIIEKMNNALIHRGPDSKGYYFHPGIGLGMRRLKIIDLQTGEQPISNEDQMIWVIFNGEIYNFQKLRQQLEQQGHSFRSHSDTECIVHLYEQYGTNFITYLRGMFAIALWDEKQHVLLLVRDRFGKKPLFYCEQSGDLIFSSELPSILKSFIHRPQIDLSSINLFLGLQYIPDPQTAYRNIYKLSPAHYLIWQDGKVRIEKYWDLSFSPKLNASEDELAEELRRQVREAVQLRMISDVPLGAHLSGGIDSSIIVSEMAELSSSPVKTFSIGFNESSFSELSFAREVAQRFQTDHHEFTLDFNVIPKTIDDLLGFIGEPLADPSLIPLFHLSRLTRQYVTVALNGDGGDESFGGYQRYWLDPWANLYFRLPHFLNRDLLPTFFNLFRDHKDRPIGGDLINGLRRLKTLTNVDPRASILRWSSFFSPEFLCELWNPGFWNEINYSQSEEYLVQWFEKAKADSFLDRTLYVDTHTYLPGDLLVKADRMNMAHSLEGRSPFLDHELAQWAARLPEQLKVRRLTGKILLRKAFAQSLPNTINRRGKQGFGIPISSWLRGPLSEWLRNAVLDAPDPFKQWFNQNTMTKLINEHQNGTIDHGKRLWALAVLSHWSTAQLQ